MEAKRDGHLSEKQTIKDSQKKEPSGAVDSPKKELSENEILALVERELKHHDTIEQGLRRLNALANTGSTKAMLKFAKLFEENKIYKRNYQRAMDCLLEADQRRDPEAAYQIGRFYRLGLGVDPDAETAYTYFRKAVKRGHKGALYQSAVLALELGRCAEGAKLLRQSINAGFGQARYDYAVLLINGIGVEKDVVQAERILKILAAEGDEEAKAKLTHLFAKPQFNE